MEGWGWELGLPGGAVSLKTITARLTLRRNENLNVTTT